jgi:PhzF family phenazine biosynthesis protein
VTVPLHLIDAFATGPFSGNPAAVVWLDRPPADTWMQQVAMEMNQAETAFVQPHDGGFGLRWFTPTAEVDLCGHATLATAHYLWDTARITRDTVARFATRSGTLSARCSEDGSITLDFPAVGNIDVAPPADLAEGLGVMPRIVRLGGLDLLCVVDSAEAVRGITPYHARIARWPVRGVIVTAAANDAHVDFVSRCFFPGLGVPEDPVTGSAHCALAVFWGDVLRRSAMAGYQASRRGAVVRCEVQADRVNLSGRAITVVRGELAA